MTSQVVSTVSSSLLVGGPVPHASRQGRHRQRYGESGERLLAGCIPVRMSGCPQKPHLVQVCMITTTSGSGLVFPKGGWEDDESVESAAQRETVEEAGVRGVLEEPLLGIFPFASGKAEPQADGGASAGCGPPGAVVGSTGSANGIVNRTNGNGNGSTGNPSGRCKAYIYVMHVAEELPCWPESKDRQRVWCSIPEAVRLCKHQWMREALRLWVRRKGWEDLLLVLEQQQQSQAPAGASFASTPTGAASSTTVGFGTAAAAAAAFTAVATNDGGAGGGGLALTSASGSSGSGSGGASSGGGGGGEAEGEGEDSGLGQGCGTSLDRLATASCTEPVTVGPPSQLVQVQTAAGGASVPLPPVAKEVQAQAQAQLHSQEKLHRPPQEGLSCDQREQEQGQGQGQGVVLSEAAA